MLIKRLTFKGFIFSFLFLSCQLILPAHDSSAAEFTVDPVRVFFVRNEKTKVLNIVNNSENTLTLQLSVFAWSQDGQGKDVYVSTDDIIAFPKIFRIKKESEQIIRLGNRMPPGESERTYRIYMEEIPQPQSETAEGAAVRTFLKVGVPIFIEPLKTIPSGKIENAKLAGGQLSFSIRNDGNVNFIAKSIKIFGEDSAGAQVIDHEFAGWYILANNSKFLSLEIPKEECLMLKFLEISVLTDRLTMKERLDVRQEMCLP